MGSTVRIISPGMLSTVERQNQPQQLLQQTQQVTNMPATYHVPRGPAAVANISAPRSTVATPIVRANTGQTVPTTRSGYVHSTKAHLLFRNVRIQFSLYTSRVV